MSDRAKSSGMPFLTLTGVSAFTIVREVQENMSITVPGLKRNIQSLTNESHESLGNLQKELLAVGSGTNAIADAY
jgi:hypothetical protein